VKAGQTALVALLCSSCLGADLRYAIRSRLDEAGRTIDCSQTVFFRNPGPDTLTSLRFHLYPNAFRGRGTRFARDREASGRFDFALAPAAERGRLALSRLAGSRQVTAGNPAADELEVGITPPLAPGDTVTLRFDFSVRLPAPFAGLGVRGRRYVLGDWYPQLAWRDSASWRAAGFSGAGGSPSAFADYDVWLTVPSDLRVAATGTLLSPSDEVGLMKLPPGVAPAGRAAKTLHFQARDVPGFAWLAAPDLVLLQDSAWGVNVSILTRYPADVDWGTAAEHVRRVLWDYTTWYGPLPSGGLTIADARGLLSADASFPGLVLVAAATNPVTRLLERSLAFGIAEQWFNSSPCPDPQTDPWLRSGLPAFSALRYLETEHGRNNLLSVPLPLPQLDGLSEEYLSRVIVYAASAAGLSRPPGTAADRLRTEPFGLSALARSQAALQLRGLQRRVGERGFDELIRSYLGSSRRRCPGLSDFLAAIPDSLRRFLQSDPGATDYSVGRVTSNGDSVGIRLARTADSPLPVDVEVRFADGSSERHVWQPAGHVLAGELRVSALGRSGARRRVAAVKVDPDRKTLEPDRWNNSRPRRAEVHPLFRLPSLDAYQIFYGPYGWYDNYHGFQLGLWTQGRRFVDAGPVRGRHMWTVSEVYSTRIRDWHTSATYQTPLDFISPRLRLKVAGDYSLVSAGARAELDLGLGRAFRLPRGSLNLGYRFLDLYDLRGRDLRAWDAARIAEVRLTASHSGEARLLKGHGRLHAAAGVPRLGGSHHYYKLSLDQTHTLRLDQHLSITLRLFGGTAWGALPAQEQFYLSGGLVPNDDEPISWGYQGMSSGQEHWHYDADVNCRAYSGSYRHGRWAYGLNVYLPGLGPFRPFFDVGNVASTLDEDDLWQPLFGAGIRFKLGPVYADFPVWKSHPGPAEAQFAFRWLLGFKLSDLLSGL